MTFKNQHFVFGGETETEQISQIIGCSLTRVGTLSFDHRHGACTNVANNKIYLCFNDRSGDYKKCRFATSPTGQYTEVQESTHEHRHTKIASSNSKSK